MGRVLLAKSCTQCFPLVAVPSLFVVLVLCAIPTAQADDWPQWRGPSRDGIWREDGVMKTFPAPQLALKWRAEVGNGSLSLPAAEPACGRPTTSVSGNSGNSGAASTVGGSAGSCAGRAGGRESRTRVAQTGISPPACLITPDKIQS